ncbi:hypothetical protein CLU79DRAFT_758665 [Phycomyces nitens]|nr:hypothetical protein CLU79DRAFT_758665 [Phycomyces nitens]
MSASARPSFSRTPSIASSIQYNSKRATTQTILANCTLHDILTNPRLLFPFERFLRGSWSHENLLFIEAMSQLRHENDPKIVETTLHRIYKTFIACGSPLELNVTTQAKVKSKIDSMQWAILSRKEAVAILAETEDQVLTTLNAKLAEYIETSKTSPVDTSLCVSMPQKLQKKVVIVGGGFTGFTVGSILDPMHLFHVTLIDTKDSFEYTPGIVKKIVDPSQSSSLRVRHDSYIVNGTVILGHVEEICSDAMSLKVNGDMISFDYLVVATGSSYSSQLKSTDISSLYRLSGLEDVNTELQNARKVLIIGGGLVGCELASEIADFEFPGPYPKKSITMVESHSNVVSRSDVRQQERAHDYLGNLGVEIVCNERIVDFDSAEANVYVGSSGRVYQGYEKVFVATGTKPNSDLFMNSTSELSLESCLDIWGRIRVKPTLQIDHFSYQHIFAGGDVTNVVEEKTGYAATIAGVCIARNICRLVKGKPALKQGTKGTLPAPDKPLHGMKAHGGIGKQSLNILKKKFSFLNPSWAALKYFNETQFTRIVQGQGGLSSHILGRLPRRLMLPSNSPTFPTASFSTLSLGTSPLFTQSECSIDTPKDLIDRTTARSNRNSCDSCGRKSTSRCSSCDNDSNSSIDEYLVEHFTFGGENIELFAEERRRSIKAAKEEPPLSPRIKSRRTSVVSAHSVCTNKNSSVSPHNSLSTPPIHV